MAKTRTVRYVGRIHCVLDFPSIHVVDERNIFSSPNEMVKARRFISRWLPQTDAMLEGGSFRLSVDVRYLEHQGYRRIFLCKWRSGESVSAALDAATVKWKQLKAQKSQT